MPLSKAAKQGLSLAKSGDCVAAAIALERAESEDHRPVTAAALAGCHVALGELVLAHEIYEALAKESAAASWTLEDRISAAEAKKKALALEARIPKVLLEIQPKDARLDVRAGGRKVELPFAPIRVSPDEKVEIEVRAEGFATEKLSVVLGEGQKKTLTVVLKPVAAPKNPELPVDPPGAGGPKLPSHWMGVRFRGLVVPQFLMNIVGEGGTSTYWPGVGLTYTERLGTVDIEPSLTFTSYALGTTAFKPHGVPDTEWELLESDLWGATAALDIMYRVALDTSGTVELRIGGGFGIGLAFTGDLYRWQSFPKNGEQRRPRHLREVQGPERPGGDVPILQPARQGRESLRTARRLLERRWCAPAGLPVAVTPASRLRVQADASHRHRPRGRAHAERLLDRDWRPFRLLTFRGVLSHRGICCLGWGSSSTTTRVEPSNVWPRTFGIRTCRKRPSGRARWPQLLRCSRRQRCPRSRCDSRGTSGLVRRTPRESSTSR